MTHLERFEYKLETFSSVGIFSRQEYTYRATTRGEKNRCSRSPKKTEREKAASMFDVIIVGGGPEGITFLDRSRKYEDLIFKERMV